ncbi:MFS transporter [Embleya scabrispora]|uniref:MFS transporter n=1 Tax=Embleya scabrispora TaxID=159449 RepID=UPI000367D233|nr:MFS transporter [Embleya scabrispora]MYS84719.1 DHA2 family efflux MFS transporter permease subunit [Streptomyces sp. SID5474]
MATQTTPSTEGVRPDPGRPSVITFVVCSAAFVAMLDVFVVNVAFNDIGADFDAPLADLSWVLNAYAIVYAALLVPAGRLADRYGRKPAFLAGLALFTVASAACSLAPQLWWLVFFRGVQAVGAAMLTPASLGLLLTVLPTERRAGAVRIWATTSSFAAAVGPVVGGGLVELSWRWVFLINIPVGVAAFAVAHHVLPDLRDASAVRMPDPLGTAALVVAFGAVSLGLVKGQEWTWTGAATVGTFAVAAVGIAVFVVRILSHPAPVVDPALFRTPTFVWANITVLMFCTAFGAVFPSVVLWLQGPGGYSTLVTGLAIAPGPLMVPLFAAVGRRLATRLSAGALVAAGNLLFACGALLLAAGASPDTRYATQILPGWLVIGVGIGLAMPVMLSQATVQLPAAQAATGSAVVNTSRQLGYVLGVAILVAVLGTAGTAHDPAHTFQHAWWFIAATAAGSAATAYGITGRTRS